MERLNIVFICFLLNSCGSNPSVKSLSCEEKVTQDDNRPNILVIGDSISIGYTPFIQAGLEEFEISHNLCNAMNSENGLKNIDQWLKQRDSWEAITFNHGLWDLSSWAYVPDDKYADNLRIIARKVKEKTDKPLFILTTEVPDGANGRVNSDVLIKNAIAIRVMNEESIPVLDLYTVSQTLQSYRVAPNNVHFTDEGSQALAVPIVLKLLELLGD